MLMHSAINNTKDIAPSIGPEPTSVFAISASRIGWLTAGLMWVCAAYLLVRMKRTSSWGETRTPDPGIIRNVASLAGFLLHTMWSDLVCA